MAVATKNSTKLALVLITGSKEGKDIKKTMNLSKVKTSASDDNIFATAKAIEPLLKYPVSSVKERQLHVDRYVAQERFNREEVIPEYSLNDLCKHKR